MFLKCNIAENRTINEITTKSKQQNWEERVGTTRWFEGTWGKQELAETGLAHAASVLASPRVLGPFACAVSAVDPPSSAHPPAELAAMEQITPPKCFFRALFNDQSVVEDNGRCSCSFLTAF